MKLSVLARSASCHTNVMEMKYTTNAVHFEMLPQYNIRIWIFIIFHIYFFDFIAFFAKKIIMLTNTKANI